MTDTVYSLEQIMGWQSQLKDFAKTARTRFSKKQAVEALIEDIEAALEAHPYDEVSEKLKDWGLDIAPGSLKQYVNAYRREHRGDNGSSARKRSGHKKPTMAGVKQSAAQSQSAARNAAVVDDGNSDLASTTRRAENRTKRVENKTPRGFLEMAEDL